MNGSEKMTGEEREAHIRRDCDDFEGIGVDDVKFLLSLLDEARKDSERLENIRDAIDAARLAHSRSAQSHPSLPSESTQ